MVLQMTMDDNQESPKRARRGIPIKVVGSLVLLVVAALAGATGMYYLAKEKPQVLGLSSAAKEQEDVKSLLNEVASLMSLPDESPTVATVTDAEKVTKQPFFKNAKNGDRVIIYPNAKKAILYRPSEKRIIDVGAVNINRPDSTPQASSSASPQP